MKDLPYKIALTKIPLVGAVTAKNLISYCGGVEEVFRAKKKDLLKIPGVGEQTAENILNQKVLEQAEREIEYNEQNGIHSFFYLDKNYPQRLRGYHDAPVMLFYKGTANLNHHRIVGVIGTRKPSSHGVSSCEEITESLLTYKPLILSGLAYGIDIAAHRKSLELGLETIAVLGHGLANVYPAHHRQTAMEITRHGGLLTEFGSHVSPERENFPMRNRIVAGLCDALIVVESATRGGSLITARQANGYNKEVFAMPGRVKDKHSQGCNMLIKRGFAHLVENADDVARVMRWELKDKNSLADQPELFYELSDHEKIVIDLIHQADEMGVDQLSYRTNIATNEMSALLLTMEFKGLVRSLPGKRYVLG